MSSTPKGERRPLDAYITPDPLAQALVGLLPIHAGATVLEPHVGGGAFARAVRAHRPNRILGVDINPAVAGCREVVQFMQADFLAVTVDSLGMDVDWIVGNPPFTRFEAHVDRALAIAPNVAFLLRAAAMESDKRIACWRRWPLRKVWILAERPSFTGGGKDSAAYGWFWFERGFTGPAQVVPGWSWKRT